MSQQREIKFRLWRYCHSEKKFKYYHLFGPCLCLHDNDVVFSCTDCAGYCDDRCEPLNEEILEQWTGLKDKNGKEIFDGDLVEADQYTRGAGGTGVGLVSWGEYSDDEYVDKLETWIVSKGGWWKETPLSCAIKSRGVRWSRGQEVLPDSLKVVGNIHENPELLKTSTT